MIVRRLGVVALLCVLVLSARFALADEHRYVIAIGNNQPPSGHGGDATETLRFADDDAAAMAQFGRELGAEVTLLAVLDADSQRRFPELGSIALPPTLATLRSIVADHRRRFEDDRKNGHEPVLILFFSGHGVAKSDEPPALTLLDGPLTNKVLYDEVLANLPARYVHLVIDACHAETVVRPRDAQAEVVNLSDEEAREYVNRSTLARFPNVGAVIATSAAAQSQEWDLYERGIFTYEVLSALRGGADVNHDGRIEYSELLAFLSSANAGVSDPRAKLSVVVRSPQLNPRAPIVDISRARRSEGVLGGPLAGTMPFFVEDGRGNRLAEIRPEVGFRFALVVPSGEPLYVRSDRGEGEVNLEPGERVELGSLKMSPRQSRVRGAMEAALRRGLFATPFGPTYYRGFVDGRPEMPPVEVSTSADPGVARVESGENRTAGYIVLASSGALAATSFAMTLATLGARRDYEDTDLERAASDAHDRFTRDRAIALATGIGAVIAGATGTFLVLRPSRATTVSAATLPGGAPGVSARISW